MENTDMGTIDDVVSELESIGAIGGKVVMLKQPPVEEAVEKPPQVEEEEAFLSKDEAFRVRLADLSLKADEKLAAVIEAVQDLRGVFQELHEATQGEPDAEISEEA